MVAINPEIVNGHHAVPDAATVAQIEDELLSVLYRTENRILEQVDEKIASATVDVSAQLVSELNHQFTAVLEALDDRLDALDARIRAMESWLLRIAQAIDEVLQEAE